MIIRFVKTEQGGQLLISYADSVAGDLISWPSSWWTNSSLVFLRLWNNCILNSWDPLSEITNRLTTKDRLTRKSKRPTNGLTTPEMHGHILNQQSWLRIINKLDGSRASAKLETDSRKNSWKTRNWGNRRFFSLIIRKKEVLLLPGALTGRLDQSLVNLGSLS